MKTFKKGVEIRLEKEDLIQLLEKALNKEVFMIMGDEQKVSNISLHPVNKYVCRITIRKQDYN